MLRPIPIPAKLDIQDLPAITFGAGCFSGRYNGEKAIDVAGLVQRAYELGIRAFDTSPYYGDSEILLGEALSKLFRSGVKREELYIMTKCGRNGVWDFDYSPESIRRSVERSCERLGVTSLDVVYMHDAEFVKADQVCSAASMLFKLKDEGTIGYVGMSGYPLEVLDSLAKRITQEQRPLDIILSYSHYNIQNTTLIPQIRRFKETGIKAVSSASPLSMGLLKEGGPPDWHPASATLKEDVLAAVDFLADHYEGHYTMANLAVGYALKHAKEDGVASTVIGFCAIEEMEEAVQLYWEVVSSSTELRQSRNEAERQVTKIMSRSLNETWPSPPEISRLVDPAEQEEARKCLGIMEERLNQ